MGDDGGALLCEGSVPANVIGVPMGVDDIAHGLAADLCDAGDQPRHGRFVLGVDQEQSVLANRKPDIEAHISPVITPGHIVDTGRDLHRMVVASAWRLRCSRRGHQS